MKTIKLKKKTITIKKAPKKKPMKKTGKYA